MQRFEIDNVSKAKILCIYEIFKLDSVEHRRFLVFDSYKKIIENDEYNVYVFSDYFHFGIRVGENTIYQKVIDVDFPPGKLTRRFLFLEGDYLAAFERMKESRPGMTKINEIFMTAHRIINSAINEYINRDIVYNNYVVAKRNHLHSLNEDILEKIKKEESCMEALRTNRNIVFKGAGPAMEHINLEISLDGIEHRLIKYSIKRKRENLNKMLDKSRLILLGCINATETEIYDMAILFNYFLIWMYYHSKEAFIDLTTEYARGSSPRDSLIRIVNNGIFNLESIVTPIYNVVVLSSLVEKYKFSDVDIDTIELPHLELLLSTYDHLVEIHKRYVSLRTREIEVRLFNLGGHLGGMRDTIARISPLMRIDEIRARINELRNLELKQQR